MKIAATRVGPILQAYTPGQPVRRSDEKGHFTFDAPFHHHHFRTRRREALRRPVREQRQPQDSDPGIEENSTKEKPDHLNHNHQHQDSQPNH